MRLRYFNIPIIVHLHILRRQAFRDAIENGAALKIQSAWKQHLVINVWFRIIFEDNIPYYDTILFLSFFLSFFCLYLPLKLSIDVCMPLLLTPIISLWNPLKKVKMSAQDRCLFQCARIIQVRINGVMFQCFYDYFSLYKYLYIWSYDEDFFRVTSVQCISIELGST